MEQAVKESGNYICLTHTYTGYPIIKEARQQVLAGHFGKIRKVWVQYPQGWLSTAIEKEGNKQAAWRTDPQRSGIAGAMGDIGTHAFNLAEYVTGLKLTALCADIQTIVPGRRLDDDGAVLLRFDNGASGVLIASQVATGSVNNISIKVAGETGGLEWEQDHCNRLLIRKPGQPLETWETGSDYLGSFAKHNTRTPAGHPEGYLEAFANHYRNFALCVGAKLMGETPKPEWLDFPGIEEGVRGMRFIEKVIASGQTENKWTAFE